MSLNQCKQEEKISCKMQIIALNDFIEILGGKWRFPIIFSLFFSSLRFSELKRQLTPITSRSLTQNLEDLMLNQLIEKEDGQFILSEHTNSLRPIVDAVMKYHSIQCHNKEIDTEQAKETLDEAMKSVFQDLAGKWRMVVMGTMHYGGFSRFNELEAVIPGISAKELTRNLNSLIDAGIIEKKQDDSDTRGSYVLTERGRAYEEILREMVEWAMNHREFLKRE